MPVATVTFDTIQLRFDAMRGLLTGAKVREILRAQFRGMHAPRWANATYFVDLRHVDKLEAMSKVITELYGGDAKYNPAPVFNTASVREHLKVAIGESVKDDATRLMGENAKKLAKSHAAADAKPITPKEFERANELRQELARQAETMMANYGDEIDTVREALAMVDAQVMEMWGQVTNA
jgi:hypothetical protein